VLHATGLSSELEGPFLREGGAAATALNVGIFVAMLLAGALLLLVLLRLKPLALRALGYAVFALATFVVCEIYLAAVGLDPSSATVVAMASSALSSALAAVRPSSPTTAAVQVVVGSLTGAMLTAMVPPTSMLAMLLAASLYDVYAVYKGPLQRLLQSLPRGEGGSRRASAGLLVPFAVDVGGLALGMGDVILYASLSSLALLTPQPDPARLAAVVAAGLVGVYLTLELLVKKRGYAPALTLPVLASAIAYVVYNSALPRP